MTVYVDEARDYGEVARCRGMQWTRWAHLTADSREELHLFAARLGLRRAWFQDHPVGWHYDLSPGKRAQALRLGACAITWRELGVLICQRRAAQAARRA